MHNPKKIEQLSFELIRAELDFDAAKQTKDATLCESSVLSACERLFEAINDPEDVKVAMRTIKVQVVRRVFEDLNKARSFEGDELMKAKRIGKNSDIEVGSPTISFSRKNYLEAVEKLRKQAKEEKKRLIFPDGTLEDYSFAWPPPGGKT